ncbi:hypothetical protein T492DRAFT_593293 [Pavlovales sp. CCMP2436]|nr:hypothetical protein T492DRAFT_593293 [Pavlovales sp. CCMP2436]
MPSPQLFDAIARESEGRIGSFKPQEMANTAWAFATLGLPAPKLFDAIARESEQRIGTFNPQDLSNTAWSFATLGVRAPKLFDAIVRESVQHIGSFTAQNLTNTVWAYASAGVHAPELFDAIAYESEQRIGSFKSQDLANTAWAFAVAGVAGRDLLVAAINARAAEIGSGGFTADGRSQLHQFFLSVELELRPPVGLLAPAELRLNCRQTIIHETPITSSKLHRDVSAELRRMPSDDEVSARAREAVRAATAGRAGIVIEVDGPTHYDSERRLIPSSEMKRRHLALVGWVVLAVPYWEWRVLEGGHARKTAYLAALLASAGSKP